jgi:hypothetical protein
VTITIKNTHINVRFWIRTHKAIFGLMILTFPVKLSCKMMRMRRLVFGLFEGYRNGKSFGLTVLLFGWCGQRLIGGFVPLFWRVFLPSIGKVRKISKVC